MLPIHHASLSDLAVTLYPLSSMCQESCGSFSLLVTYQLRLRWPTQATYLCLKIKSKIAYTAATLVIPVYLPAHRALKVSNGGNIIMVPSEPPIMDDFRHRQSCPSRYILKGPYLQSRDRGKGPKNICKEYSGHYKGKNVQRKSSQMVRS